MCFSKLFRFSFHTEATPPCAQLVLLSPCRVLLSTVIERSGRRSAKLMATVIPATPLPIMSTSCFFINVGLTSDSDYVTQHWDQPELMLHDYFVQKRIVITV